MRPQQKSHPAKNNNKKHSQPTQQQYVEGTSNTYEEVQMGDMSRWEDDGGRALD